MQRRKRNEAEPAISSVEKIKAELLAELQLMTPADLRCRWKHVHWKRPNLLKLAEGNPFGPLRYALERLPTRILSKASEQLDPFGWLLGAVDIADWGEFCRERRKPWLARVWLATASQLRAESRLIHKAHGWAGTWEEVRQNPHDLEMADNNFLAELAHAKQGWRCELLAIPELADRIAKARQDKDEAFLRRFRRAKRGEGGRAGMARAEDFIVQYWLELPGKLPGLCFYSEEALASLLEAFGLTNGSDLATKQIRVRLGLIQAGTKRHLIERFLALPDELRFSGAMLLDPWILRGKFIWNGRQLWPR